MNPALLELKRDMDYLEQLSPEERKWLDEHYIKPGIFGDFRETSEDEWPAWLRSEVQRRNRRLRTDADGGGGDALTVTGIAGLRGILPNSAEYERDWSVNSGEQQRLSVEVFGPEWSENDE
jgi:hypothetical protein